MCANLCDAVESPVHVNGAYNVVKCAIYYSTPLWTTPTTLYVYVAIMKSVVDNLTKKKYY